MDERSIDLDDNPDWSTAEVQPLDAALKLQAVRARLGLSQSLFASLLNMSEATLRNWEQRRTRPDAFARQMIDVFYDDPEGMRDRLERRHAA